MSVTKALEPRYDINTEPDGWVMPNRTKYVNWVDKSFKYGKPSKQKCTECTDDSCPLEPDTIDLFPHQKFIKDYMQWKSPYRGILLYHGLGSGKTLSSIAAAEILMNHMDVTVLLPTSLEQNYILEVRKYGRRYFAIHQHWVKVSNPTDLAKFVPKQFLPNWEKLIKTHKGLWVPDLAKASNFSTLPTDSQKQIMKQTDYVIRARFDFKHTDGLRELGLKKMGEEGNPFDNKCVIIDEVHNLISRIVNGGKTGRPLYNYLMEAKNCKLILLSGTPVINRPYEFSFIVNLITGYRKLYECQIKKGNMDQVETHLNSFKYVDFYQLDKQKKTFTFTVLPSMFRWKNKDQLEVKRSQHEENVFDILKSSFEHIGILITDPIISSAVKKPKRESEKFFKALPEDEEAFNSTFIDEEKLEFKNGNMFMRRLLGSVSYYNNFSRDLFPSVTIHDNPIFMPKYMFTQYQHWRMIERQKERPKASVFQESTQVYRFYSRAVCNFVFPKEIPRLFPVDLKKCTKELDDVENLEKSIKMEESKKEEKYDSELKKAIVNIKASDYLLLDKLQDFSPKFYEIVKKVNDLKGTALVYSQFRKVEGLGLLCATLEKNGYCEFKIKRNDESQQWELDIKEEDMHKPKFFQFRGTEEKTQILLKIFNSDLQNVPPLIREKLQSVSETNMYGDWIKVIMITQSGSEGISLKNVRQVHIVEPFWNHVRMDQVIGRAVRTCSHVALPPEERHVDVYIYYMVFTKEQIETSFTIRTKDKSMTSDYYLYDIAKKKKKIISNMLQLIKQASIDCALNSKYHKDENIKCFSFPSNTPEDKMSHTFHLSQETFDNEFKMETENKTWKGQVIVTKKGKFLIRKETGDVYDYDLYVDAQKLVLLGKLITEGNKRIIKLQPAQDSVNSTSESETPSKSVQSSQSSIKSEKTPEKKKLPSKHKPSSSSPPMVKKPSLHLGLLKNNNNSCYLDSFFMAIMHKPNPIIQGLLNASNVFSGKGNLTIEKVSDSIKQQLTHIYNKIQEGANVQICTSIRSQFANFDSQYATKYKKQYKSDPPDPVNWVDAQNEPLDVSLILSRIFKIPASVGKRTTYEGKDNSLEHVSHFDPVIAMDNKEIDVADYIPVYEDTFYNEKNSKVVTKYTSYTNADAFFVTIKRGYISNSSDEAKSTKTVVCPEYVTVASKDLALSSIIVHHGNSVGGGHYTCYILHQQNWFHFDDLTSSLEYIGPFSNIPNDVFKNCVNLVYF